jgi:hypothetical protein
MIAEESSVNSSELFREFGLRLKTLFSKNPSLISLTLSNIFTMRLIGNKTHGDLAEIAIAEFINQYMYDYKSLHVGKDLFRAKTNEEDITILSEITGASFPVSLKVYGDGPLQLSTDKSFTLFPLLESYQAKLNTPKAIIEFLQRPEFEAFFANNTLPLIYDEKKKRCNILIFDKAKVLNHIHSMRYESAGNGRKHPVFRFYDAENHYLFEVRYGGANANALQRGVWTHTKQAYPYFESLTNGWIDYAENPILVRLFSHALVASERGHSVALEQLKADITQLKREYPFQ